MTCYVVANYRITNPTNYQKYLDTVGPSLQPHDGQLLASDYEAEVVENTAEPVVIILRFPSKAHANAWYHSPEYQKIAPLRINSTEGHLVIAKGLSN